MELYNPDSRTFFTPTGELGICYHEMRYVSSLDYGEFVYEERVPPLSDLEALSIRYGRELTDVYWEVLCHFWICVDIHHCSSLRHTVWARYFFPNTTEGGEIAPLREISVVEVERRMGECEITL